MANQLLPDIRANMPAHILARIAARDAAGTSPTLPPPLASPQPQRVSIEGNRFTMIKADGTEVPVNSLVIEGVIAGCAPHDTQTYYAEDFKPGQVEYKPPTCFSDNGIGPSRLATSPQALKCDLCPHRAWGSAISKLTNKGKPACQRSRKLAFLWRADGEMYRLSITPGSFRNWDGYLNMLKPKLGLDDVVTEVSFAGTGILALRPIEYTPDAAMAYFDKARSSPLYHDVLGLDDKPISALTAKQAGDTPPLEPGSPPPDLPAAGSFRQHVEEQTRPPIQYVQTAQPSPAQPQYDAPVQRDPYAQQAGIHEGYTVNPYTVNPMTGEILPLSPANGQEAAPPFEPTESQAPAPAGTPRRGRRPAKVEEPAAPPTPPPNIDAQLIAAMQRAQAQAQGVPQAPQASPFPTNGSQGGNAF